MDVCWKKAAVPAGAAASLFNAAFNEVVVPALWLNDMEVVLAPAGVNVGIAGVLFLLPFVMGFQRSCWIALLFFKSQNCVSVSYTHLDVYKRQRMARINTCVTVDKTN